LALVVAHQLAGAARCTGLAVGDGSCAVVESGAGHGFVIDGGSMGRGRQVARIVSRFVWQAGYRHIDAIFLSHADVDHYNGLAGILRKLRVSQLLTTSAVLASDSPSLQALLQLCETRNVKIVTVKDGTQRRAGPLRLTCFQAADSAARTDNQRSLAVRVQGPASAVLLPGDLEGRGAADVYRRVGTVPVLVSPHHGSPDANRGLLAQLTSPELVIVSGRDCRHRRALERLFASSHAVVFTAESGAVVVELGRPGCWTTNLESSP